MCTAFMCLRVCVCVYTLHQTLSLIHLSRLLAPTERIALLMSPLGGLDVSVIMENFLLNHNFFHMRHL